MDATANAPATPGAPVPHPVYDAVRQVLQRTLERLNGKSERHCNAGERPHNGDAVKHMHTGKASGLATAALILEEEMNKLPKSI